MVPKRIAHYEIIRILGKGGMGTVYLAKDTRLDRSVALKVLPPEFAADHERMRRFTREARAASALSHPNVAYVYEVGEAQGFHYIAIEYVEGKTLSDKIAQKALPLQDILDITQQIADALEEAHSKGIIHRDIKPGNVIVTSRGQVKVLDFGIAKRSTPVLPEGDTTLDHQPDTAFGLVFGTVRYMSPEQIKGQRADRRSDLFSLGIVLYEMATGRSPFASSSASEAIARTLSDQPQPITDFNLEAPPELDRIIRKCLEKDPASRYQSARDLLVDIKNLKRDNTSGVLALPPQQTKPPRRLLRLVLVSIALAGAVAIAAWLRMANRNEVTLVVLPFENATDRSSNLGDRLAERLNIGLNEVGILKVKPLLATRQYAGGQVDFKAIARELGVTGILAGRLRQTDEDLEVFAELTDGRDGNVIWSKDYIEKLSSTQEIVAKIARAVMENLRPRLGRAELNRLDCLALYSKGRDEWNRRNPASLRIAIQYFEEATRRDPRYAPAHIGLADCYNMLGIYGEDPPSEVFPKAKKAAEAALKVDDSLSEAHTSLAFTVERHDFNRTAARQEYELAIKLSSSKAAQATAYHRYGVYLIGLGKFSESIEKIKLAQDLDPFSQIIMTDLAQPYLYSGNYEEAIRICDGTIKKYPSFAPAYRYRGLAFERAGSFAKAVSDLEEAVRLSPDSPLMKGELGHALASAGLRDKAMAILTELEEQRRDGYRSCYRIAQIYACLGEPDKALAYLERALEERDPALWYVEVDPIFDRRIGSDLRFKELKKRLALR